MRRFTPVLASALVAFLAGLAVGALSRPAGPVVPDRVEILQPAADGGWRKHSFAVTSVATGGETIDVRKPADNARGWYVRLSGSGSAVAVHCEPEGD